MTELKVFSVGCILISISLQVLAGPHIITGDTKLENECTNDVSRWQTIRDFVAACCDVFYNYKNPHRPIHSNKKHTYISPEELQKLIYEGKFGNAEPKEIMIKRMRSCMEILEKQQEEQRNSQPGSSTRSSAVASSVAAASRGASQRNLSKRTTR